MASTRATPSGITPMPTPAATIAVMLSKLPTQMRMCSAPSSWLASRLSAIEIAQPSVRPIKSQPSRSSARTRFRSRLEETQGREIELDAVGAAVQAE
nr:hypothetical protein [Caballeronia sp. Lep1P3]